MNIVGSHDLTVIQSSLIFTLDQMCVCSNSCCVHVRAYMRVCEHCTDACQKEACNHDD